MPIKSINATQLVQVCALCGAEHTHNLTDLQLGDARSQDPDTIAMPACPEPDCGTREWLKRTWDECDPRFANTPFYDQRCVVNTLAQKLKALGRTEPTLTAKFATETGDPPQMHPLGKLTGAGHAARVPDRKKGAAMWAARKAGREDLHPAHRADKAPKGQGPGKQGGGPPA